MNVFGLPISVIGANRGLLSFCLGLDVSGSWIIPKVANLLGFLRRLAVEGTRFLF